MSNASSIESEIDLDRPGKQLGYLRLPHSVHRSAYGWIPIPIASICGGAGPTVLLMAGNHGDEYEGQVVLSTLIRTLAPEDVNGQLIILPMANFPAAAAGLRTSPLDEGNLNRLFPGNPRGTPSAMIAHYIESQLVARVELLVDLHSGGSSLLYQPTALARWPGDRAGRETMRGLIEAFGLPNAVLYPADPEGPYSSSAASRRGIAALTTELGGGGTVDPAIRVLAEAGLRRALHRFGVLAAAPPPANLRPRLLEIGPQHHVYSYDAGLFEPLAAPGDTVAAGQPAALVHRPETPGLAPVEIAFEAGGIVLARRVPARVVRGDCLFQLGGPVEA
ncbi:MAG: succinylglutamate desuccinylase/aspartoacylase family protein [Dongiaceae bacterium]